MGIPEKLSTLRAEELRQECDTRSIASEGLTRELMIQAIILYEHRVSTGESSRTGENDEGKVEEEEEEEEEEEGKDEEEEADTSDEDDVMELVKTLDDKKFKRFLSLHKLKFEHKKFELDHKYRMKRLDKTGGHSEQTVEGRSPKMPSFKEGDDVEVYLNTFERLATANGWNKTAWAPRLGALLSGKAREAYSRMSTADAGSYDQVKQCILERYDLTAEVYRRKFRNSRKQSDESFREWGNRARRYFERWVGSAINSANDLVELMLVEQLITNMTPELQVWIREHQPKDMKELTDLAEAYRLARQGTGGKKDWHNKGKQDGDKDGDKGKFKGNNNEDKSDKSDVRKSRDKSKVTCYKCQRLGHYASECTYERKGESRFVHSPSKLENIFN